MPAGINEIGNIYGDWKVIGRDYSYDKKNGRVWICECTKCGYQKSIRGNELRRSRSLHCQNCRDLWWKGKRFGILTCIKVDEEDYNKVVCQCDCGKIVSVWKTHLLTGATTSCGNHYQKPNEDLTNQKFGLLTPLYSYKKNGRYWWHCKCDCEGTKDTTAQHLKRGACISCGCIRSQGEYEIEQILKKYNVRYKKQHTFRNCRNPITNHVLPYDFYLLDYNCCIEFDGVQHAQFVDSWHQDFKEWERARERDKIKDQYCLSNGIPLIRIPYSKLYKIVLNDLLPTTSKFLVKEGDVQMRLAQIRSMDISNGDGIGISIFTQGCPQLYHCKNCHNMSTWTMNAGRDFTFQDKQKMIQYLQEHRYVSRLSILGGEPLLPQNLYDIKSIILSVKSLFPHLKIYLWTGTTFENLLAASNNQLDKCDDDMFLSLGWTEENCKDLKAILYNIDYLIDGRFVQEKKDLTLRWRGSSNQRIIDVPRTLKENKIITL